MQSFQNYYELTYIQLMIMIKRLLIVFLVASCTIALVGCDSDSIIEDPVNVNVNTINADEGDTELEKLVTNVGYYYGDKPNLALIEFAYRETGIYCIFPQTESRKKELENLAKQEGSQIEKANGYFDVTRSRNFITADDYVSDRYFAGYYNDPYTQTTHDYIIVSPRIIVCVYNTDTMDEILKDYKGKLTLADHEQGHKTVGDCYIYFFDCHIGTSEQVLKLSNNIFLRNDVKWSEPNKYQRIHYI